MPFGESLYIYYVIQCHYFCSFCSHIWHHPLLLLQTKIVARRTAYKNAERSRIYFLKNQILSNRTTQNTQHNEPSLDTFK